MSLRHSREAWKANLKSSHKLVLLLLADMANDKSGECWPSVSFICERTDLSERTVQAAKKCLIDQGYISLINRRRKTQTYRIHPCGSNSPKGAEFAGVKGANSAGEQRRDCAPGAQISTPTPAMVAPKPIEPVIEPTIQPSAETLLRVLSVSGIVDVNQRMAEHQRIMTDWLNAGYEIEADVIPGIKRAMTERPTEITHSLKRFSTTIAQIHQLRICTQTITSKKPRFEFESEDPRMSAIRHDIYSALGLKYLIYCHNTRFEVKDDIICLSGVWATRILDEIGVVELARIAQRHGFQTIR